MNVDKENENRFFFRTKKWTIFLNIFMFTAFKYWGLLTKNCWYLNAFENVYVYKTKRINMNVQQSQITSLCKFNKIKTKTADNSLKTALMGNIDGIYSFII